MTDVQGPGGAGAGDSPSAVRDALSVVRHALPVECRPFKLGVRRPGLVIIDEVNGFATVGCGPLAPPVPDPRIDAMVLETDRLARRFVDAGWPVAASLDSHDPTRPEPPYPPHCLRGSGDDELVPALRWLETAPRTTLIAKDCIDLFVGAMQDGRNLVVDWINEEGCDVVVVVGICTDICVMDFVLTLLSARNHGLTPALLDVVVHEPACATYDLPLSVARGLGLPDTAAHPQEVAHHVGLYAMASRGALVSSALT